MLVGQFGSHLSFFLETLDEELEPGDVILRNDPYLAAARSRMCPTCSSPGRFSTKRELVGFTSQFGNLLDVGGKVFGSMPASARSIYEEGLRFPAGEAVCRRRAQRGARQGAGPQLARARGRQWPT